jgi:hypothetical protein
MPNYNEDAWRRAKAREEQLEEYRRILGDFMSYDATPEVRPHLVPHFDYSSSPQPWHPTHVTTWRFSDEPLVSADVAAYLAEWYAKEAV